MAEKNENDKLFEALFPEEWYKRVTNVINFAINRLGVSDSSAVSLAKILGCVLPMLAKKLKLDPAIMAAPLITTIVDSCSILIYFSIAVAIMHI